ncbi:hypothetical protein V8E53_008061 [Lactarius tabidus]
MNACMLEWTMVWWSTQERALESEARPSLLTKTGLYTLLSRAVAGLEVCDQAEHFGLFGAISVIHLDSSNRRIKPEPMKIYESSAGGQRIPLRMTTDHRRIWHRPWRWASQTVKLAAWPIWSITRVALSWLGGVRDGEFFSAGYGFNTGGMILELDVGCPVDPFGVRACAAPAPSIGAEQSPPRTLETPMSAWSAYYPVEPMVDYAPQASPLLTSSLPEYDSDDEESWPIEKLQPRWSSSAITTLAADKTPTLFWHRRNFNFLVLLRDGDELVDWW